MYALQCMRDEDLEIWMGDFLHINKDNHLYVEIGMPDWYAETFTKGSFISRNGDKICDSKIDKARIFETKREARDFLKERISINSEVDKYLSTSFAAACRLFDIVPITIVRT